MTRRRTIPACVYCGQPGLGDPPLCRRCYTGVQDDGPSYFNDLLHEVLNHPRVDELFDAMTRGAQDFVKRKVNEFGGRPSECPPRPPDAPPPPPPSAAPPPSPSADARTVLGFDPGCDLTVSMVKQRQRALASMFHPDAGGCTESMQRVNVAAEELLAELR